MANSFLNFDTLNKGLTAAGKIFEVTERVPSIQLDEKDTEIVEKIDTDIHLRNVTFKYSGHNDKTLDDVSITILKGKTTAIVGPSGSGKSTVVKLLERFYDPHEGQVIVNGKDLRSFNLRSYRRRIGYVGQEPCLFNATIKENLLNSNSEATDEEIWEALRMATADKFVKKLPKGINSDVGSIGGKLSGGQKQRIAIARALIRKPDMLIFDEATSALDTNSEEKVQAAIDKIGEAGITKVVIAHRLTTIMNADKIVVLKDGEVVEEGTHKELLESKQEYAKLFATQTAATKILEESKKYSGHGANLESSHRKLKEKSEHTEVDEDEAIDDLFEDANDQDYLKYQQSTLSSMQILSGLYDYTTPKIYLPVVFLGATLISTMSCGLGIPESELGAKYLGTDYHAIKNKMALWLPIIVGLGLLAFFIKTITHTCLFLITSKMVKSLRQDVYNTLVHQPIEFFDRKENSTGQLTATLAQDIRVVNGASIEVYVLLYQSLAGVVAGIVICLIIEWNYGLLALGIIPVTALCLFFQTRFQLYSEARDVNLVTKQRVSISDSIVNYSTVASLANEQVLVDRCYSKQTPESQLQFGGMK